MEHHQITSDVSKEKPAPPPHGITRQLVGRDAANPPPLTAPDVRLGRWNARVGIAAGFVAVLLIGAYAGWRYLSIRRPTAEEGAALQDPLWRNIRNDGSEDDLAADPRVREFLFGRGIAAPDEQPTGPDWSLTPSTPDERVCTQFIHLKNADDATAVTLLGPVPAISDGPVSRVEADHLQAEFFLRQDVRIVGVGRDRRTKALVLYTKGNVFAPTLQVKTATGAETAQRTMSNPDLTVEVRDGRIYGVAANLHVGP
jgi:hypothetical protein